jgi:hypothetical protein
MRPAQTSRAVGVTMDAKGRLAERSANLAKADEKRLAFKQRNPDQGEMPSYMPFGEKMVGGKQRPAGETDMVAVERAANLAKAEEQRLAFKQRNPDQKEMPSYMPFGEKMGGGKQGPSGEIEEDRYKYSYYLDKEKEWKK